MGQVIRIDALYFQKARERTTAQLRAELAMDRITRDWLTEFMAGMELEQRFAGVMLNIEERV